MVSNAAVDPGAPRSKDMNAEECEQGGGSSLYVAVTDAACGLLFVLVWL